MKLYKYTTAEYGLAAIRERRIKVTTLADTNDPNEWLPVFPDPATGEDWHRNPLFRNQFKTFWSSNWGFISLSRLFNSILMWGHYADKFRGMVLAFDVIDKSKVIDVRYSCERYELGRDALERPTVSDFENLIGRKDWTWVYEQECRLIVNLQSCTTKRLPNGDTIFFESFEASDCSDRVLQLIGVVLGSECTITMEDVYQAFDRKPPQGFQVMQLAPDSFSYSLVKSDHKQWDGSDWVNLI